MNKPNRIRQGLIADIRHEHGIRSEAQLATELNCSRSTLRRVAAGEQAPSAEFAALLASKYGVPFAEATGLPPEQPADTR